MNVQLKLILSLFLRYSRDILVIFYNYVLCLFFKDKHKFKDAWLICERGIEARDNGYVFFKYLRENYPDMKVFYLIDFNQYQDYDRVKVLGNVIQYNSFEHKMALFYASHFISTHIGFITPWSYKLYKLLFAGRKNQLYVLLNHGITKEDMTKSLNKYITGIDIFIAATKNDWELIALNHKYGYDKKDVLLTGYARYDNWHNYTVKRQILFMPTWRKYLVKRNVHNKNNPIIVEDFFKSSYFTTLSSFLNNKDLHKLLVDNDIELLFYPHYELQKSIPLFKISNSRVIPIRKETHDIADLLKESALLISDYSGVTFDFAYMNKPLIYYQFDQDEYYSGHYLKGDFEMEKDGLGLVVKQEEELIQAIKLYIENNFQMEPLYSNRMKETFTFRDSQNCARIYNGIINYKKS